MVQSLERTIHPLNNWGQVAKRVQSTGNGVDIGMLKMNRPQPYEDFKRYLEDNSIDLSSGHLKVGFSF